MDAVVVRDDGVTGNLVPDENGNEAEALHIVFNLVSVRVFALPVISKPIWLPLTVLSVRVRSLEKARKKLIGRKAGIDGGKIPAEFNKYDENLRQQDASDRENFMEFWGKLLKLVGDFPGRLWGMRTSAKFGLNPYLYTTDAKGKRVVMAHLWGSGSSEEVIHILVTGKYLKDEFKPLFPKRTFFYGKGSSVDVPYPALKKGKDEEHLNCFKGLLGSS